MTKKHNVRAFIRENSLSLVLFGLFFVFLVGLALTGYVQNNEQLAEHQQSAISLGEYLTGGEFAEAVFENWESEFLQMGALVVLTIFLRQKGSTDSKKLRGKQPVDSSSRYSIIRAANWRQRSHALGDWIKANSLSLALFGLFLFAFVMHAVGGVAAYNEEAFQHSQQTLSVWAYVSTSQFWYESFQNWQSEFLAVGALLLLSVFLRQRGSPESKPIGAGNDETGE